MAATPASSCRSFRIPDWRCCDALEIPSKIQRNVGHCPHLRAVQVSLQVATQYGLRDTTHAVAPMNTTVAPEQILLNSGENRCFYQ